MTANSMYRDTPMAELTICFWVNKYLLFRYKFYDYITVHFMGRGRENF